MEDFIKKMIEAADAAGKELKVEISKIFSHFITSLSI